MRFKLSSLMILARLAWGEFNSPLHLRNNMRKFFPPPIVYIYKESLRDYFFRN